MNQLRAAPARLGRLLFSGRWAATAFLVAVVAALQLLGYTARSQLHESHDLLGAAVLLSALAVTAARHRHEPLPWMTWLGRRARNFLRVGYQHGYDLRGTPPYPARLPPGVWWFVLVAVLVVGAAVAAAVWVEGGVRGVVTSVSYVAYLGGLLVVWAGLFLAAVLGLYLPDLVGNQFFGRPGTRREWAVRLALLSGYVTAAWALSRLVAPLAPLSAALAGMAAVVAGLTRRRPDDAAFLWRAGPGAPISAVPMRLLIATILGCGSLLVAALVVLATGEWLWRVPPAQPDPAAWLTPAAGTAVAWLMPGVAAALAVCLAVARRLDPAARDAPTVAVRGARAPSELASAARAVAGWGWRVRRPGRPPADVAIEIVSPDQSEVFEFEAGDPLKLSVADLALPEARDRLARRDEMALRKAALRGARQLFRRAFAERKARGGSFQFAPHWWFMDRLTREEPRRARTGSRHRQVAPPFQRVFAPRVRQHFHAVLRAAQVDLILIEDGVGLRRIERVLRELFDLYHKHQGARRAEEHLFRGIPKVRVMLHDYAPEAPFKATRYAEPHLNDLDRARVLHVFRDAGEAEVPDDAPFDFSYEPSPALGFY